LRAGSTWAIYNRFWYICACCDKILKEEQVKRRLWGLSILWFNFLEKLRIFGWQNLVWKSKFGEIPVRSPFFGWSHSKTWK